MTPLVILALSDRFSSFPAPFLQFRSKGSPVRAVRLSFPFLFSFEPISDRGDVAAQSGAQEIASRGKFLTGVRPCSRHLYQQRRRSTFEKPEALLGL